MCLRAQGLVEFRSSERRWSNISTRAINISLVRSENRPSRKSLEDQLGAKLFGPFPLNRFFHNFCRGWDLAFLCKARQRSSSNKIRVPLITIVSCLLTVSCVYMAVLHMEITYA